MAFFGLFFIIFLFIICISYGYILHAQFCLTSQDAWLIALSTCDSHVAVLCGFYITIVFSFLIHWFQHNIMHCMHILGANLYFDIPPSFDHIIYDVRTKKERDSDYSIYQNIRHLHIYFFDFVSTKTNIFLTYWVCSVNCHILLFAMQDNHLSDPGLMESENS